MLPPATMMPPAPSPGSVWRHFKGCTVLVLGVGRHSETGELLVLYRELETREDFARPVALWNGEARPGVARFIEVAL